MKYKIIDNFLSKEDFSMIESFMMGVNFPWYYNQSVTDSRNKNDLNFYFTHLFFIDNKIQSNGFHLIEKLIYKINPSSLIRVKGNLYPNIGKMVTHDPHVDYEYEHKGAIYYINTNNGSTVFEDGTKIDSIQNRILFFESHKSHMSTTCTDEKVRVNININFF